MTPVRVSDLKPQYPTRTVLLCRVCGAEASACSGARTGSVCAACNKGFVKFD